MKMPITYIFKRFSKFLLTVCKNKMISTQKINLDLTILSPPPFPKKNIIIIVKHDKEPHHLSLYFAPAPKFHGEKKDNPLMDHDEDDHDQKVQSDRSCIIVDLFKKKKGGSPPKPAILFCVNLNYLIRLRLLDTFSDSYVRWKVGSILSLNSAINTSK